MNPFSIIMFVFAGALLVYAFLMQTGDDQLIRFRQRAFLPKNKKERKVEVRSIGKIVALTAAAPLLTGVLGLFTTHPVPLILTPVALFVLMILVGVKLFYRPSENGGDEEKENNEEKGERK